MFISHSCEKRTATGLFYGPAVTLDIQCHCSLLKNKTVWNQDEQYNKHDFEYTHMHWHSRALYSGSTKTKPWTCLVLEKKKKCWTSSFSSLLIPPTPTPETPMKHQWENIWQISQLCALAINQNINNKRLAQLSANAYNKKKQNRKWPVMAPAMYKTSSILQAALMLL